MGRGHTPNEMRMNSRDRELEQDKQDMFFGGILFIVSE
jgi:hypothetical protein